KGAIRPAASAALCLRRELEPALTLEEARVRQPCQHIAVTSVRRAPTSEHQPAQLIERSEQRGVLAQPTLIQRDPLASRTVLVHHERVAPLRGAPYVNVVALALAVNRAWLAELHMRWDEETAGSPRVLAHRYLPEGRP